MKKVYDTSFMHRFVAFMIDFACMSIVYFGVKQVFSGQLDGQNITVQILVFLILTIITIIFLTVQEASFMQTTIGKFLFHFKVTSTDGTRPSFYQSLVRNSVKVFSCIYLFMFFFSFTDVNKYLLIAIVLSISTNAIWHNIMTIIGSETGPNRFVHNEVSKTVVVRSQ